MSTQIARIVDSQQVTLADFQHLADDPRALVDLLTQHMIETGQKYMGGAVSKTATTIVTVASPVLYIKNGALFSRSDVNGIEINLLSLLPVTGYQRIVAIVASGETLEDETEARDFEVDASVYPPIVEGQPTATRITRRVNLATVAGEAAPDPVKPSVDVALTVIAYVTLSSTEVLDVEQVTTTRLRPLSELDSEVVSLSGWRGRTEPVITGMQTDVAMMASRSGSSNRQLDQYMLEQLARLTELSNAGDGAAYSRTDYYLDQDNSDLENPLFVAKVDEGVRFANDAEERQLMVLQNPSSSSHVVHANGLLLPAYDDETLISVVGKTSENPLSNSGAQTVEYQLKTVARKRIRFGKSFTVCTNSQWWKSGRYDWRKNIFERNGETFQVLDIQGDSGAEFRGEVNHRWVRIQQYWYDTVEEPYWSAVTVDAAYTGNVCANTFLQQQTRWVTALRFGFSRVDSAGDVRVLLCQCGQNGAPDLTAALADTTLSSASMQLYPTLTEVPIGPVLLEAGQRYAWILITPGNHWIAMVDGNKYAQGSFFVSTDSAWFQGDISRDACFEIVAAKFAAPRLVVDLESWTLSGGITDLDLDVEAPSAGDNSDIAFEVRVNGVWYTIAGNTADILAGLPASVNARLVLQGTTELMPGFIPGQSYVTPTRPRTDLVHVSTEEVTPAPVTEVQVVCVLEAYNETYHDLTVALLTGAAFDTTVAASAVADQTLPDGSIRRVATFSGLASISSFKVMLTADTASAQTVFHVAETTFVAYP